MMEPSFGRLGGGLVFAVMVSFVARSNTPRDVLSADLLSRDLRSHDRAAHYPTSVAATTVWDSVYSSAQAARGETLYVKSCARCHQASLGGADESPALTGGGFLGNWNGLPLSDLQTRIRTTMPTDSIGIYDRQLVSDVMAYLLKANGFPAGAAELSKDTEPLRDIIVQASKP